MGLSDQLGLGVVLSMRNLISTSAKTAAVDLKNLGATAGKTQDEITRMAEKSAQAVDRLRDMRKVSVAVAGVGTAILTTMGFMVKEAGEAEVEMGKFNSQLLAMGHNSVEAAKMTAQASNEFEKMNTRISDEKLMAAGTVLTAQLGNYERALAAVKTVHDLTIAGEIEMADATDLVSQSLRVFEKQWGNTLTAEQKAQTVGAVLWGGRVQSGINFGMLSTAMTRSASEAASMGQTIQQTVGTLGFLYSQGIESRMLSSSYNAYMSGIRQAFVKSNAPMSWEEMMNPQSQAGNPRAAIGRLGLRFTDVAGNMLPMYEIAAQLEKKYNITAERSAAVMKQVAAGTLSAANAFKQLGLPLQDITDLMTVVTDAGSLALIPVLGKSDELKRRIETIANPQALQEAVTTQLTNLNGTFGTILENINKLREAMGAPLLAPIKAVGGAISTTLIAMREFVSAHPDLSKWMAWGTGTAAVLMTVVGGLTAAGISVKLLMIGWTGMTSTALAAKAVLFMLSNTTIGLRIGLIALAASQWLLNVAMNANPVGILITLMGVLVIGIITVAKKWGWATDKLLWVWTQLKTAAMATFNYLSDIIKSSPIYQLFSWIFEMTEAGIHKVRSILGIRDEAGTPTVISGVPQTDWGMYSQPDPKEAVAQLVAVATGKVSADHSRHWTNNNFYVPKASPIDQTRFVQNLLDETAIRGLKGEAPSRPMPDMGWGR